MLRVRTGYSFRTAVGKIDETMSALQEAGYTVAPITDRGSAFGWVKWTKLANSLGMMPVYGVELAVTDQTEDKRAERKEKRLNADHMTFIASDSLVPVNKLIGTASSQSWYEPLLYYHDIPRIKDVFIIAGSAANLDLLNPKQDNLYVSLSPSSPVGLIRKAVKNKFKFAATFDNFYPREMDKGLYQVVIGRGSRTYTYPQHIMSVDEWKAYMSLNFDKKLINDALYGKKGIIQESTASLGKGELLSPDRPKGGLLSLCKVGAKSLGVDLNQKEYKDRLERELLVIKEKKYEDYFYIIADMVSWARERMMVGPGRGSSSGSLICYLLGITTIDPLKYGLIFERFININRNDLPDIDIDFSDARREKVFDYMKVKYGEERISRLGTVAVYRPRSALAEAGQAFEIPRWMIDRVSETLIVRTSADSRALDTLEDSLKFSDAGKNLMKEYPEISLATRMEGHPRHSSQHAAGILVTEQDTIKYLPTNVHGVVHADKKDAEALGLLKIDALGLTQLSVFEDTLRMLGRGFSYIYNIPLDDPNATDVINDRKFAGIFQFNGMALQSLCKVTTCDSINDIIAITALARPGPMASGGANTWIRRKNGTDKITYPDPAFEPYLKDTMGVVTYQEQVMEIGRNIGGLSWEDVTKLRQAMSGSLGTEFFNQFGDRWKAGARKHGVSPDVLDKVWDDLCAYGSWAFNKSHSVAYGLISYWCCWLKHYHPYEFAAATLSHESDPDKQLKLLREVNREGIQFIPVDKDKSTDVWQVAVVKGEEKLLGPLSNIKGIGPSAMKNIIGWREAKKKNGGQETYSLTPALAKLLDKGETGLDSLWPIRDAFVREKETLLAKNVTTEPRDIGSFTEDDHESTVVVYCVLQKIDLKDENEAVKIAARKGVVIRGEPTASLNLFLKDDTGTCFGKVTRWDFDVLGKPILERGAPNKHLYVAKGTMKVNGDFTMMLIQGIRYIGAL